MTVCTAYYHGRRVTPRLAEALWVLNKILQNGHGEKSDMSMMQGSCSNSVGASAGTHAGGDAGDLSAFNQYNRVKYGRLIGFNIHYRAALRNVWSAHVHFTMLKSSTVSRAAQQQNNVWYARYGNGLANGGKAIGFLPNSKEIKFIRKDTATWRANKKTKGYAEPGSDFVTNRDAGWIFESIGVVEVGNKRYLVNATPTFYPIDDFDHWVNDWVPDGQTYQVVKATNGYEKMWDQKAPNTYREPGYIIKTVGRTTKGTIGVATENGVFYKQSDLKKIDNKYSNENPPKKDSPAVVPKEPETAAVDTGIYEVTANPSLWGLKVPGLGSPKVATAAKGTRLEGRLWTTVAGDKWIKMSNGNWYHSFYLKKVDEQTTEEEPKIAPTTPISPEGPREDVAFEPLNAEWRVVVDSKWGTVGPGGENLYERGKGYHLFTTSKSIVDNVVYYITAYGTWYSADGLMPWDVPEVSVPEPDAVQIPPLPEPTPAEPVSVPKVTKPVQTGEPFIAKIATQNVQRWRLETRPMGHAPWHKGAAYATRMEILAKEVNKLDLDIVCTQESGRYVDAAVLSDKLGDSWKDILHGDNNGDITQGIHWNTDVYTLRKEGIIKSYGSTHNRHTYVKLEHNVTGKYLWVVSCHLRYGEGMKNHRLRQMKDIVEGAWKLAGDDPIFFAGDFNNNSKDKNAVSLSMVKNGYARASSGFTSFQDTLNHLETTVSKARQVYDNIYFYKTRKLIRGRVHAPIRGNKYITPFISDHNMVYAHVEVK